MSDIWVGTFILDAAQHSKPFWGTPDLRVSVRMALRTSDKDKFAQQVRQSVQAGGASVSSIVEMRQVVQLADNPDLNRIAPHINTNAPIMVDTPVPALPNGDATLDWAECAWPVDHKSVAALWAVIDGVSWPEISQILETSDAEHACLYATRDQNQRILAPWLVRVPNDSAIAKHLEARSHVSHSFMLFRSNRSLSELRAHLRKFTMLNTPIDPQAPVYCRFYDPRVCIDLLCAMSEAFLERFLTPMAEVIVPISPQTLLPDGVSLEGATLTPFDSDTAGDGRFIHAKTTNFMQSRPIGELRVSDGELAALGIRIAQRAAFDLAKKMFVDFGMFTTQKRCLNIARQAKDAAAAFEMTSVKQVSTFAQCQLIFGKTFYEKYPATADILNNTSLLPRQKNTRLMQWFGETLFAPETMRNLRTKTAS